jgi:tripartite-type tricarboxylate transporter receptor subunit TctC
MGRIERMAGVVVAACVACASWTAAAADPRAFPQRTVRIIAGQQAGSATDTVARLVADSLEALWGVAVTVENRPGAGGTIAAEAAALAPADGHTLFVGGTSNLVIAPATEPDLRYNPSRDFVAVGRVAHVPFGFAVNAAVPARTLGELAELARSQPNKLTYATLGPATTTGFGMEMFKAEAGIDLLAVEYKGIATAIPDVVSGRVDALFTEVAVLAQHAQAGKLRLLAIGAPKRLARLPDVPTTAEQGYPRVVLAAWYGLLAPAATPPDVVKRLIEGYEAAMRTPALRKRIEGLGYEPIDDAPGQFASALREETTMLRELARRTAKAAPR